MAEKEDKWAAWRGKANQGSNYEKAQEGFKKAASDNPVMNAYRALMGEKKKDG
jgi:hypothetical protein